MAKLAASEAATAITHQVSVPTAWVSSPGLGKRESAGCCLLPAGPVPAAASSPLVLPRGWSCPVSPPSWGGRGLVFLS